MNRKRKLEKLRTLQLEVDDIRRELNIGQPGEVLYRFEFDYNFEELVVLSDGFGGATATVISGNYPIDFLTLHEKHFSTESRALRVADRIGLGAVTAAKVLE